MKTLYLGPNGIPVQAESLDRRKSVYRISNGAIVRQTLQLYHPFECEYFLKGFEKKSDAGRESECLNEVCQCQMFHRFPWAYKSPVECHGDMNIGYALVMEFINAPNILKHFESIYVGNLDLDLILLQYCQAFVEALDTVKFLHGLPRPVYHCDIKPDNVFFKNNFLKIIDFESAHIVMKRASSIGSDVFLPSYALKARLEERDLECLDVIDLQLTVGTFLMVLLRVFASEVIDGGLVALKDPVDRRWEASEKKKEESRGSGQPVKVNYQHLLGIAETIENGVKEWLDSPGSNALRSAFSILAINGSKPNSYEKCLAKTETTVTELLKGARELVRVDRSHPGRAWLGTSIKPIQFVKNMEVLLTSSTRNLFTSLYPLMYLDYSRATEWYDVPAKLAAQRVAGRLAAIQHRRAEDRGDATCLDVGSAFGTAAYRAAVDGGFARVVMLDNSPIFQRMAELLWAKEMNLEWELGLNRLLTPEVLEGLAVYRRLSGPASAREYYRRLLVDKRTEFCAQTDKVGGFLLRDYWSLSERLVAVAAKEQTRSFNYIICNNFLHWPVIGFERLQRTAGLAPNMDLRRHHLLHLVKPLLDSLARPGLIAIIEPSQFLVDDRDVADDAVWHEARYSRDDAYVNVHRKAYTELIPLHFEKYKPPLDEPPRREEKFRFKQLKEEIINEVRTATVWIERFSHESPAPWEDVIVGEFSMTMRTFDEEGQRKLSNAGPGQLGKFYKELYESVRSETPKSQRPIECFYAVYIEVG